MASWPASRCSMFTSTSCRGGPATVFRLIGTVTGTRISGSIATASPRSPSVFAYDSTGLSNQRGERKMSLDTVKVPTLEQLGEVAAELGNAVAIEPLILVPV